MTAASTQKRWSRGTHRICSPQETWERVLPVLHEAGITRVAEVTRLDVLGVPVWQAIRPATRNLSVSQGKGLTAEAARVSAAMESLELWHAEDLGGLPQTVMTPREMRYANPIEEGSLRWAAPPADRAGAPLSWVRAVPLGGGEPGWLAREMLELDFTHRESCRPLWFRLTSSGLASGNCIEEALLHGLCELVERHSLATRQPPGPLAADSVTDPELRDLLASWRRLGARFAVWDATLPELGIPVVAVDLAGPDLPLVFRGSGCHPDPEVALCRALTEAAQSRLTYISGAREDVEPPAEDGWLSAGDRFSPPETGADLTTLPRFAGADVAGDLAAVARRLAGAGYTPYSVDLTRPELGIPVAFTFVPWLREGSSH